MRFVVEAVSTTATSSHEPIRAGIVMKFPTAGMGNLGLRLLICALGLLIMFVIGDESSVDSFDIN